MTTWTTFWDSFESAIDSSTSLSPIDKFNYLRSLVEKSAAEAISGLTLTADNYKEAVTILKKGFGNKQQIITKHMDILLALEPVTSQHKLRELRQLFDLVEAQVRGLKSLGVESTSYGSLLTSVLLQKLPHELRLIVSGEVEEGDWNLDELLKQLEREIGARERELQWVQVKPLNAKYESNPLEPQLRFCLPVAPRIAAIVSKRTSLVNVALSPALMKESRS